MDASRGSVSGDPRALARLRGTSRAFGQYSNCNSWGGTGFTGPWRLAGCVYFVFVAGKCAGTAESRRTRDDSVKQRSACQSLPTGLTALAMSEKKPTMTGPSQGTLMDFQRAVILKELEAADWVIGGGRACGGQVGTETDYFNHQNEKARHLATTMRHPSTHQRLLWLKTVHQRWAFRSFPFTPVWQASIGAFASL